MRSLRKGGGKSKEHKEILANINRIYNSRKLFNRLMTRPQYHLRLGIKNLKN